MSEEKDEQAEKQWQECNDNELAIKRGFKNKEQYLKAERRLKRIDNLIKLGASEAQAIEEINHAEKVEAEQIEIDKKIREEEQKKKQKEFIAKYLGDFNDLMR